MPLPDTEQQFLRTYLMPEREIRSSNAYAASRLRAARHLPQYQDLSEFRLMVRKGITRTAVVVGGGYAGLLSAKRLTEKGFQTAILHDGAYPGSSIVSSVSHVLYPSSLEAGLKLAVDVMNNPLIDAIPHMKVTDTGRVLHEFDPDVVVLARGGAERRPRHGAASALNFLIPLHHAINSRGYISQEELFRNDKGDHPDIVQGGGNVSYVSAVSLRMLRLIPRIAQKFGIPLDAINPVAIVQDGIQNVANRLGIRNLPQTFIYHRGEPLLLKIGDPRKGKVEDGTWIAEVTQRMADMERNHGIQVFGGHTVQDVEDRTHHVHTEVLSPGGLVRTTANNVIAAIGFDPEAPEHMPSNVVSVGMGKSGSINTDGTKTDIVRTLSDEFLARVTGLRDRDGERIVRFRDAVARNQIMVGYDGDPVRQIAEYAPAHLVDSITSIGW